MWCPSLPGAGGRGQRKCGAHQGHRCPVLGWGTEEVWCPSGSSLPCAGVGDRGSVVPIRAITARCWGS